MSTSAPTQARGPSESSRFRVVIQSLIFALVAGVVAGVVISTALLVRMTNVRALKREYDRIRLSEPAKSIQERVPKLHFEEGMAPETYRNYVWWSKYGDRTLTRKFAVRHGDMLAVNIAYVVGIDESGRVAYKAIGNT